MGVLSGVQRRGCAGPVSSVRLVLPVLITLLAALGCGQGDGGPGRYSARGIVEDVDRESAQVLIDHEDVEGLMPAMTMNFVVPDADVLERLAPGQVIEFEIRFTGRSYEVADFELVGEAPREAGWRRLGEGLVRTRPAPDFDLIDQANRPVTLASFGDRALVIDFIYTECPGPCPVQTSNQVALQKRIPEALRDRIHFVSISLDPAVDRPAVLERYATERGADLSTWSFLTGPPEVVAPLVRRYGVGSVRKPDGTIDHTLITFLVRDGRVMERYAMSAGQGDRLLADLVALVSEPEPEPEPESEPKSGFESPAEDASGPRDRP